MSSDAFNCGVRVFMKANKNSSPFIHLWRPADDDCWPTHTGRSAAPWGIWIHQLRGASRLSMPQRLGSCLALECSSASHAAPTSMRSSSTSSPMQMSCQPSRDSATSHSLLGFPFRRTKIIVYLSLHVCHVTLSPWIWMIKLQSLAHSLSGP